MQPVRIGIIGLGNMGSSHTKDVAASDVTELAALCDTDAARLAEVADGHDVPTFIDASAMLEEADLEAIIIATPHYDHTPIAIAALERGIHVLCEKPVGVHVKDVHRMIDAYDAARARNPGLLFGAMFQQRTFNAWKTIREMISSGRLGRLVRATWIVTTWFRTQRYYDSGGWRATWSGEGGGVLLNQCPHNLDLYQWFFGMPTSILGVAAIGKYHRIEVEDEVSAIFQHENGMVGHFITTTAESPGTNRLEVVGELGRLVYDAGRLTFDRNAESMLRFSDTVETSFGRVDYETEEIDLEPEQPGAHRRVTEAFARAVRDEGDLVAEAREGLGSVALANGILMSHFTGRAVDLPLDGDAYAALLDDLIARSTFRKPETQADTSADLGKSF